MSDYQNGEKEAVLYEPIIFENPSKECHSDLNKAIIFDWESNEAQKEQATSAVRNPIDQIFENIHTLVGSPSGTLSHVVMMDSSSGVKQQACHQPVQTSQGRLPAVATTQMLNQPNVTPTFRKSRIQIKPFDLEKKLKACLYIRVKGENVYVFTGHFYQKMSAQDMKRIICRCCSAEIAENGGPGIVEQAYKMLLMDAELAVDHFPLNSTLVCFQNGVLDLRTGTLLPHDPKYFLTFELECAYPAGASFVCPFFDQFLTQTMGGEKCMIDRVWEIVGYCLSPDQLAKVFFVFQGVPNSGKSLLCDLLSSFFPEWKITSMDVQKLGEKFALAELEDRGVCFSHDMECAPLASSCIAHIKKFTGNDLLTADVKYSTARAFRATGKLILVSNHPLLSKTPDKAFENRIVAVPFLHSVSKEEWDLHLLEKLKTERAAIAYKAIQAYYRLRQNQYQFSGDYVVNSAACFADNTSAMNLETAIYAFVCTDYKQGTEGDYVCIADAYEQFQACHGSVSQSLFSQYFSRFAEELYGGRKVRSRMSRYTNARWCIQGMQMK